jgi:thiamine pyrophosphokinase
MGNDNRTIIFGNGRLHPKFLTEIKKGDYVIGVDKAAYWLLTHGITPNIAIGDFDSTTTKEFQYIQKSVRSVNIYPREKDKTDMELAIHYAEANRPGEIIIFGAVGTRLDHSIATFFMVGKHVLVDMKNKIRLVSRGKTIIEKASYRYISLLPFTKSITLTLTGFRYDLVNKTINQGSTLGVSNEITGKKATVEIFSGKAWVIESND